MDNNMKNIDEKILNEISRYKSINKYILEQEVELPPPPGEGALPPAPGDTGALPPAPGDTGALPPAGETPPPPTGTEPQPVDVDADPEVEKIGDEKDKTKELDITDLVNSQKNVEEKQEEYFDNLFQHLSNLEQKLSEMDSVMNKLNDLESKIEKMRPKTAQEKLELRTIDSGPFNQKLSDFFEDKQDDFEKTGRDEYILTQDEVEDYSNSEIKKSFRNFGDDEQGASFTQIR